MFSHIYFRWSKFILLFLIGVMTAATAAETLSVSFVTTSAGGQYSPKNIVAVWIETQAGVFVKTIGDWSNAERSFLTSWRAKAGTSDTDAVMGATRLSHVTTLNVTWNMLPRGGTTAVADGTYVVQFETRDDIGHRTSVSFNKNGTASTVGPLSQGGFNNITLTYSGRTAAVPAITSSATASANVGMVFSYNITASNNPTSYSATGLPAGLSVNTSTGVISGTPTAGGTFTVSLGATNATGTGNQSLALTVTAPPVISSSASASGTFGTSFSYSITASNSPTSYSATGLPSGLSVNTSSGVISGTPTAGGLFTVALGATNTAGTGNKSLALTINAPPVISSSASASGAVGTSFSYTITANNSPTSYSATGLPSGLSVNTSTGVISGTPTAGGFFTVSLGATNATGTGNQSLALTVTAPPIISSSTSASGTVGASFSYSITASNSPTSYSATGLPAGLSVNTSTGIISGTPTTAATSSVTIGATNVAGPGTATLTLTVSFPVIGAPVITSSATANGALTNAFTYTITASNTPTSFSASGLPAGLSINTASGAITGTPTAAGTFTVTIGATNASGTGTASLHLTILAAPVISSSLSASGMKNIAFSYTIVASNTPTSYSASGLPAGLSINTSSGVITGTPTAAGTFAVTIGAANASGTGTASLQLTILAAPVISSSSSASGTKNVAFSYAIIASNTPTSYSASGLPSGLTVNTSTGIISGTPTAAGTSTVTLGAINAAGTGNKTLTLTVTGEPAITSMLTDSTISGTAYSYQITGTNSPTSYSASGLPAGLSINTTTGVISGTPTTNETANILIGATNVAGSGTATLSLTISAASTTSTVATSQPAKCGYGTGYSAFVLMAMVLLMGVRGRRG